MSDMLVKLYDLQEDKSLFDKLASEGISIKRALPPDRYEILEFIKKNFTAGKAWAGECEVALSRIPVSCYIAVKNKEIVGFGCYDATAKGYFGPTGVIECCRNKGIGKALLVKCLVSMREDGYGYGIIGWPETHALKFYEKAVGAIIIEDSTNGIYKRMIEN